MFVDSHVNLHGERYEEDLAEVLARADEAGIGAMLLMFVDMSRMQIK